MVQPTAMQLFLSGRAGRLEARLWESRDGGEARAAAVFCHPHPLFGGTMHSTVCFRAARALQEAGLAVLRFNFRGAGLSEGEHDGAGGEEDDLEVALDWMAERYPGLALWAGGTSFGARCAAAYTARTRRPERIVLVALPVTAFDCSAVEELRTAGLVCQGEADEFGNLAELEAHHPNLYGGLELAEVEGADHFFEGRIEELTALVRGTARRWLTESG
ncbi:MAG: alpha/beta hydrolase [Planctomycetota bacterium]|nr:alpha/beta hydrolase [Planctomycetota bacterium]MDP6762058.1 alpha/beta hydrolase [Planctomycetota bacterium]MDP6989157.1 alpha/beta hydrolase [Planctomycetota bacterium]